MQRGQRASVGAPERAAHGLARGVDRVRIDVLADLARDVGFGQQACRQGGEGVIDAPRAGRPRSARRRRHHKSAVALGRATGPNGFDAAQEDAGRQTSQRLPAIEVVAVVPGEDDEILLGKVIVDPHWRGEAAQERWSGTLRHLAKDDRPLSVLEFDDSACESSSRAVDAVDVAVQGRPGRGREAAWSSAV